MPRGVYRNIRCNDKDSKVAGFTLQKHQTETLGAYLNSPHKGMLLYHKLGSGKTCTAIAIADSLLREGKVNHVYILTPGSLRGTWIEEYCTKCGMSRKMLYEKYTFVTYNYMVGDKMPDLTGSLVIIDEVHNLVNGVRNGSKHPVKIYNAIYSSNCRVLALSGTPIFHNPDEFGILGSILKVGMFSEMMEKFPESIDSGFFFKFFNIDENGVLVPKNPTKIKRMFEGVISYFPGSTDDSVPKIIEMEPLKVVMTPIQEGLYFERSLIESNIKKPAPSLKRRDPIKYELMRRLYIMAKKNILTRAISNFYYPGMEIEVQNEEIAVFSNSGDEKKKKDDDIFIGEREDYDSEAEEGEKFKFSDDEELEGDGSSEEEEVEEEAEDSEDEDEFMREARKQYEKMGRDEKPVTPLTESDIFSDVEPRKEGPRNAKQRKEVEDEEEVKEEKEEEEVKEEDEEEEGKVEEIEEEINTIEDVIKKTMENSPSVLPDLLKSKGGWIEKGMFSSGQLYKIYSTKIFAFLVNFVLNMHQKHLVFSFFKNKSGVYLLRSILRMCGIKCDVFTGDMNDDERKGVLSKFNGKDNIRGEKMRVLLVTEAGAEGITVKNVRHIHILESSPRYNKVNQAIGRVARFRSHNDLPPSERTVKVWRYWSTPSKKDRTITVDVLQPDGTKKTFTQKFIGGTAGARGIDKILYDKGQQAMNGVNSLLNLLKANSVTPFIE